MNLQVVSVFLCGVLIPFNTVALADEISNSIEHVTGLTVSRYMLADLNSDGFSDVIGEAKIPENKERKSILKKLTILNVLPESSTNGKTIDPEATGDVAGGLLIVHGSKQKMWSGKNKKYFLLTPCSYDTVEKETKESQLKLHCTAPQRIFWTGTTYQGEGVEELLIQ